MEEFRRYVNESPYSKRVWGNLFLFIYYKYE
jgi:hypothetical protein